MDECLWTSLIPVVGLLVTGGIAWGVLKTAQSIMIKSHESLKKDYIGHKENTQIHIDPIRDAQAESIFRASVDQNFEDIKEHLEKIDSQFNRIENRISALSGKSNGNG